MATPFAIQKHIPIPSIVRDPASVARKYDYGAMDVGDFFFVPNKEKNTLSSHASGAGKRLGRKFLTRLIYAVKDDDGDWSPYVGDGDAVNENTEGAVQGIGVWRLPDAAPAPDEADDEADEEAGEEEDDE